MSAISGLVLTRVIYEQGGNDHMWTCHAGTDLGAPNTIFDMYALSSALGGLLTGVSGILPLLSSSVRFIGVAVDDLSPTGLGTVMDGSFTDVGTDGAPATGLSCITVTKLTGAAGRSRRGRSYIGGMSYDRTTDEGTEWTSGFVAVIQALYTEYMATMSDTDGQDYFPKLYHRASDTVHTITECRANSEIYRQKKRVK